MIRIGYLTMAYLYWFTFFGYSWVLQRHLDIVREQILHPDRIMVNERCFTKFCNAEHSFNVPYFAAAMIDQTVCASLLYQNVIVVFPTPHSRNAYEQLERTTPTDVRVSSQVKFFNVRDFFLRAIVSVSHDNRMIILPDPLSDLLDTGVPSAHLLFTDDRGPEPSILQPISAAEANRLKQSGKAIRQISIDARSRRTTP